MLSGGGKEKCPGGRLIVVMVVEQLDARGRRRCRYPASGSSGSRRRVVEGASARSALAIAHCTHLRVAAGVNGGKAMDGPVQRAE